MRGTNGSVYWKPVTALHRYSCPVLIGKEQQRSHERAVYCVSRHVGRRCNHPLLLVCGTNGGVETLVTASHHVLFIPFRTGYEKCWFTPTFFLFWGKNKIGAVMLHVKRSGNNLSRISLSLSMVIIKQYEHTFLY